MTFRPRMIDDGGMVHAKKHYAPDLRVRERKAQYRARKLAARKRNIAVLDMETDPFDNQSRHKIFPFLAVLYSNNFEPKVIWDDAIKPFIEKLMGALQSLTEAYTIYAHNGGRFDYMFLIHKMRGEIQFKGRGIMRAKIGIHELRDSFHIIPEALATWKKDKFEYEKLHRNNRHQWRDDIIRYCINDCKYLLEIIQGFIDEFGFKISIGAAAMATMRQSGYKVKRLGEQFDGELREFFFGGRVQCLQGAGEFRGHYKSYDKNSMYPSVMSNYRHPTGDFATYTKRIGDPNGDTVFIDLFAENRNALVARDEDGATTTLIRQGRFLTTIWEYNIAMKHGLIEPWNINCCYDCAERTDFSNFVLPLYERRIKTKHWLKDHGEDDPLYWQMKKDDTFIKLILNNAYGKFAINPRRFKCHYITDPGERPNDEWLASLDALPVDQRAIYSEPEYMSNAYWIWHKPAPGAFYNNVGTAASITGAARAELMDALQGAHDAIYCDTDSIICRSLSGVVIDPTVLGAWKLEDEFSVVRITGKKQYAGEYLNPKSRADGQPVLHKVRSKGAGGLQWDDFGGLLRGDTLAHVNRAPTLDRYGAQNYIERNIRMTAHKVAA